MYQEASKRISEFNYRKMFGLSKTEMLNEPLEDYFTNSQIQTYINQKEEADAKRVERKAGTPKRG